jgi:multicomponent Na+:H+ antiporter subunit G
VNWTTVADVVAAVFLILGSFLVFSAGVGLNRFPDVLFRLHAVTKPQVLGLLGAMAALALRIRSGSSVWMLVLVALFALITAPVSAHMVSRAAIRTGQMDRGALVADELADDIKAAQSNLAEHAAEEAAAAVAAAASSDVAGGSSKPGAAGESGVRGSGAKAGDIT